MAKKDETKAAGAEAQVQATETPATAAPAGDAAAGAETPPADAGAAETASASTEGGDAGASSASAPVSAAALDEAAAAADATPPAGGAAEGAGDVAAASDAAQAAPVTGAADGAGAAADEAPIAPMAEGDLPSGVGAAQLDAISSPGAIEVGLVRSSYVLVKIGSPDVHNEHGQPIGVGKIALMPPADAVAYDAMGVVEILTGEAAVAALAGQGS